MQVLIHQLYFDRTRLACLTAVGQGMTQIGRIVTDKLIIFFKYNLYEV